MTRLLPSGEDTKKRTSVQAYGTSGKPSMYSSADVPVDQVSNHIEYAIGKAEKHALRHLNFQPVTETRKNRSDISINQRLRDEEPNDS